MGDFIKKQQDWNNRKNIILNKKRDEIDKKMEDDFKQA